MKLIDYVLARSVRGACTCERCIDAQKNPEEKQPEGHMVNLTFFKVGLNSGRGDRVIFLDLVKKEFPQWLDGKEHSYLQVGGEVGDQGLALMIIGFGHLVGAWKALTPDTLMPFLPDELKKEMAGRGMISLQA